MQFSSYKVLGKRALSLLVRCPDPHCFHTCAEACPIFIIFGTIPHYLGLLNVTNLCRNLQYSNISSTQMEVGKYAFIHECYSNHKAEAVHAALKNDVLDREFILKT